LKETRRTWVVRSLVLAAIAACIAFLPGTATRATAEDIACPWMDTSLTPDQRASALLAASTLDQKLRWLDEQAANNPTQLTFSGVTYASPQVPCTPIIQYTDGPWGVNTAGATAFPVPVAQTASWDPALSYAKGKAQGYEAFNLHRNVVLAPGLGIARHPFNGRNSEYMGEDPVLAGTLASSWIDGLLTGNPTQPVEPVLKHYVGNDQELNRQTSSSNVDDRTLHELYELPFGIAAGARTDVGIMCSYNQVNGVYTCENPDALKRDLKQEFGFEGWVVTDFGAQHSTVASLNATLDQELNRPRFYTPTALKGALAAGQITEAQINDAAFRVVRAHIAAGLFDNPLPGTPATDVSTPEDQAVARQMAEEGTVLLKNQDKVLPLQGHGLKIAVIGPTATATPTATNGVSAQTVCSASGFGGRGPAVPCAGSVVAPLDAITARAAEDGDTVTFDNGSDLQSAAATAKAADVAIVLGYYTEGEGSDRTNINLDNNGDALISAVAGANENTIAIVETGSAVLMPWLDQVKGVFEAWYPGVQQGNAFAGLLFGDVNPSGKLPVSFPRSVADLPTSQNPASQYPGTVVNGIRQYNYSEALEVGYRWYEAQHIQPLFPFGFGLSYTTFDYDHLQVTPTVVQDSKPIRVRFRLTNTGSVAGTEVAQVYLTLPAAANEPSKRLAGYTRVSLQPGQSQNVEVTIDPTSVTHPLSYWDSGARAWTIADGTYTVSVGGSSASVQTDTIRVHPSGSDNGGK